MNDTPTKENRMSDYEKVLAYLRERCEAVRGERDGDDAGTQEERAYLALDLLELLEEVDLAVKELDL